MDKNNLKENKQCIDTMVVVTRKRYQEDKARYPNKRSNNDDDDFIDDEDDDDDYDDDDDDFIDDDDEEDEDYKGWDAHYKYNGFNKKYFESLSKEEQDEITTIEDEIKLLQKTTVPLRFQILKSDIEIKVKAKIIEAMDNLETIAPFSSEYNKKKDYINDLCKLPIGKYKSLPVAKEVNTSTEIAQFLADSRKKLNDTVFGHVEAKEKIIRLLAQWISNPNSKGLVIGIDGPMGCGKTTLIKEGICKVLGLPFGFIPLGGCSDGSFLTGHSYTYEGSKCGKICEVLKETGYLNTIFYFDELDKVSGTYHGDEIINILIHMTDQTQSECFHDKYFSSIPVDLSRSLIIFSFNDAQKINPILRDRMSIIKTYAYKPSEKIEIARNYLIPEMERQYNIPHDSIRFSEENIRYIVGKIDEEKGVRNLKRALNEIFAFTNYKHILQEYTAIDENDLVFPLQMSEKIIDFIIPKKNEQNELHSFMYC